ncbi:MAG: WYL domain-containing protein [Synergistaceae bacterium]|nr:WYL domain-containing protein [Synergistaceae bacterium]
MKAFKFLILAVIISFVCVNCGFATETSSDEKIDLRKTDEERQADFDDAVSKIPYNVTELDKVTFEDGLKRSKNNFTRLYRSQWKNLGMTEKLERAVNTAFDENTKDLLWGTTGVQLAIDKGDIISKIQEAVAFKFQEAFDDFLRDLEDKWGETLQKDVADFYRRTSVLLLASENNPMTQAYIRTSSLAEDKSISVMERIKTSIQEQYPDLKVSGGKFAGGFMTFMLRKQITKMISRQITKTGLRKLAGTSIAKIAGKFVPVVGWTLMAWSAYDVASMAWSAPDDVRNMLQNRNLALYKDEIPEIYWDAMQPYVMDTFIFSYGKLQQTKEEASILAKNSNIEDLSKGLNADEAMQFIERISALSKILGRTGYDDLLEDFGELIRDSSRRDFETLASMLQQGNKLQVKEWLSIAGAKYFELYNAFPKDIWGIFPPNKESLDALTWMIKLPPRARNVATQLSISDIKWIMNELPERYVSHLFSSSSVGGNDPEKIHDEIRRLSELPNMETRRPWQSSWDYYCARYGFYIKVLIIFLAAILILRVILSLRGRAKKTKESIAPNNNPVNVNHNFPYAPIQPQLASPGAQKYKVKAKISARLADELKNIIWDMSQQIIPSEDESESRILSVEVENLDGIANWLAKNKREIEVLQPEELKNKLNS